MNHADALLSPAKKLNMNPVETAIPVTRLRLQAMTRVNFATVAKPRVRET